MSSGKIMVNPSLTQEYERDFHGWLVHNAELLRSGELERIDAINLAEELEGMGRKQHHELVSRLKIVLLHLLKWQFQAQYRSRSWNATLLEQRQQLADLLEENPSLHHDIGNKFSKAYAMARKLAAAETGLPLESFPRHCPYRLDQALNEAFYPL
uniref:DUF29 domain-containing protein n=1 Tax=Candidatus Kentrum eta TaxID=2126337 RepID=A0A450V7G5_9GAMM|nr:MAG: protein of unknown function DUF29 [Candidatus Kentron sp. H]VFK00896.1 MAG: protein of unknown function DUF29 [Candidatus Kentron sp. H]VFK04835.1 MAG: protein of unknown function DUF29 [Candidatus Kentron sp. H]